MKSLKCREEQWYFSLFVDTSGSMSGAKIGTVNSAIEEVVPELKDISESNADAQVKVATLSFSTGARWIDSAPVAAENFRWNYPRCIRRY